MHRRHTLQGTAIISMVSMLAWSVTQASNKIYTCSPIAQSLQTRRSMYKTLQARTNRRISQLQTIIVRSTLRSIPSKLTRTFKQLCICITIRTKEIPRQTQTKATSQPLNSTSLHSFANSLTRQLINQSSIFKSYAPTQRITQDTKHKSP